MIITISREFGSGGRELGKRLADALMIPCYDHELIEEVARRHSMSVGQVESISEQDIRICYPRTIANRFSLMKAQSDSARVASTMQRVILSLASNGDCVIVGRCADVILRDQNPFCIFVYADEKSRMQRCRERAKDGENLSSYELQRRMRLIDKGRADYRSLFTEEKWGAKEAFHLCINTSGKQIRTLVPAVAVYVRLWYSQ